ncbi:hypothetical protein PFICI_14053 [Pestalotiopsis fici W106-1]|uniref:AB hydrolase-1 domain-containing protein n=1 Tax=Pestalotiopsis fici (strain W106-1 / CGMCC3.15140) TaxID=1229662 RepID=W3WLY9_PESFW|nr:uncharacterized protein PFICI_14053 [Pestalotiopsis fici W106-1]ETS74187.1 hypothetical protein PFICI_14053 [Pestalotiopsis fici W106-1]
MTSLLIHFSPSNPSFGYEALRVLGYRNYGGADVAETGEDSLAKGNVRRAEEAFLRASNYYRTAEFYRRSAPFEDEISNNLATAFSAAFVSAARLMQYPFEEISILYRNTTLPGFIFNAARILRHDQPLSSTEGLTVLSRSPDPNKLVLFGWSIDGYLAARAVTSEHRFAAVILDDGVFDFGSAFRTSLPSFVNYLTDKNWDKTIGVILRTASRFDNGARWGILNAKWTLGLISEAEVLKEVSKYNLSGLTDMITSTTLVLDAPDDHFLKGQPQELFGRLKCEKKFVSLRSEQGATTHCQGAFSSLHQVIFDYLYEVGVLSS